MSTLDRVQNERIVKALGKMASPLFSTVAKLYIASPGGQWKELKAGGALTLVIDRTPPNRSMHIKMLDLQTYDIIFSNELYEAANYKALTTTFHSFEIENSIIGFAFADAQEAQTFEGRVKAMAPASSKPQAAAPPKKSGFFSRLFSWGSKEKEKETAPVAIGAPTNFVHTCHIGFDPEKGFKFDEIPEQWKTIFRSSGVKKKDLTDPDKAKVIYDIIQNSSPEAEEAKALEVTPPPPSAPPTPPALPPPAPPVALPAPAVAPPMPSSGNPIPPPRPPAPKVPPPPAPAPAPLAPPIPPLPPAAAAVAPVVPPAVPAAPPVPVPVPIVVTAPPVPVPVAPPIPVAPALASSFAPPPAPALSSSSFAPPAAPALLSPTATEAARSASDSTPSPSAAASSPPPARGADFAASLKAGAAGLKKVSATAAPPQSKSALPQMTATQQQSIQDKLRSALANRFQAMNNGEEEAAEASEDDWSD